ncbi:MAG: hypothetical protein PHN98_02380 [Smithellaceae bacterium]|nr:hypothetical protein [Smithellaceae bacterium]
MKNEDVLARIHMDAVLSNFEILTREDADALAIAQGWDGSIFFMVGLKGPRATLEMKHGAVRVGPGKTGKPDIVLFFPNARILNNLFTGKGSGFPIPLKGLLKARGLKVFSMLAKRMEAILKGANPPREIKARLLLNTVGKAIAAIAASEPESQIIARGIRGVAEVRIKNDDSVNITFSGQDVTARNGRVPDPDLVMEFATQDLFLNIVDDKVDVFAAICLEDILVEGDLHMGEAINLFLDRVGIYLQ